jgi:hypothetical protein
MTESTQTWQVSAGYRRCGRAITWGCGIVAAGVMVAGLIDGSTVVALIAVAVALLFAGFSAAGYLLYLRPSLSINDAGLFIRNPLREHSVPWTEVERIEPGPGGLVIYLRNANRVRAWAVQKTNIAAARNREVRADRVARQLAEHVAAVRTDVSAQAIVPSESRRIALSQSAKRNIVSGVAVVIAATAVRILIGH